MKGVLEQANKHMEQSMELGEGSQIPFLEPSKNQPDISWIEGRGSISAADLNLEDLEVNERTAKEIGRRINNLGDYK